MDFSVIDRIVEIKKTLAVCERLLNNPQPEVLRKDIEREKEELEKELKKLSEWLQ